MHIITQQSNHTTAMVVINEPIIETEIGFVLSTCKPRWAIGCDGGLKWTPSAPARDRPEGK